MWQYCAVYKRQFPVYMEVAHMTSAFITRRLPTWVELGLPSARQQEVGVRVDRKDSLHVVEGIHT